MMIFTAGIYFQESGLRNARRCFRATRLCCGPPQVPGGSPYQDSLSQRRRDIILDATLFLATPTALLTFLPVSAFTHAVRQMCKSLRHLVRTLLRTRSPRKIRQRLPSDTQRYARVAPASCARHHARTGSRATLRLALRPGDPACFVPTSITRWAYLKRSDIRRSPKIARQHLPPPNGENIA